jgi:hypothetical protein
VSLRVCLWFPNQGRVPHISLVFREMWDSTALSLRLSIHPTHLTVNIGGIPPTRPWLGNQRQTRKLTDAFLVRS